MKSKTSKNFHVWLDINTSYVRFQGSFSGKIIRNLQNFQSYELLHNFQSWEIRRRLCFLRFRCSWQKLCIIRKIEILCEITPDSSLVSQGSQGRTGRIWTVPKKVEERKRQETYHSVIIGTCLDSIEPLAQVPRSSQRWSSLYLLG